MTDSNVPYYKDRSLFGGSGKKDEEKQDQYVFGKKDEQKEDQYVHPQSHPVNPYDAPDAAYTGGFQHTPPATMSQQPQRYGQEEGGNKQQDRGLFGKKDEEKEGQQQSQPQRYGQADNTRAPAYTGGVQHAFPPVSQQPQRFGQGESGNKQHETERYGQGEGGNGQHEPQRYGQAKDSHVPSYTGGGQQAPSLAVSQQPQRFGQGDGGNKQQLSGYEGDQVTKEQRHQKEEVMEEIKEKLPVQDPAPFGKKDEVKEGQHRLFGKKDEEKGDQDQSQPQRYSQGEDTHAPAYTGGVQHFQQPQRYGQGEGGNKKEASGLFGKKDEEKQGQHGLFGKKDEEKHAQPQRFGQGEHGSEQQEPKRFGQVEDSHAPAHIGGVKHAPSSAVSHQPRRDGQKEGENKQREPEHYGQGEAGKTQHEPQRYGKGEDTHLPTSAGVVKHLPTPGVTQQPGGNKQLEPQHDRQGEGENGRGETQPYGQGVGGYQQRDTERYPLGEEQRYPLGTGGTQRHAQGEGGYKQHEPERYSQGEGGKFNRNNNTDESDDKREGVKKGGMMDKNRPGHQDEGVTKEEPEKKGFMEKIKEKLPGRKEGGKAEL